MKLSKEVRTKFMNMTTKMSEHKLKNTTLAQQVRDLEKENTEIKDLKYSYTELKNKNNFAKT